jgi:cytochrome c biogenesis protein CcmG/thiol:disulfide interchange protein DsbE
LSSLRTRRFALQQIGSLGLLGTVGLQVATARSGVRRAGELRIGDPAPPATLVTLDGKRISTNELLGRVVVVAFLATWCEPCREELPLLSAYQQMYASKGLRVLGFSLDEPRDVDKVREMARPLRFPVGLLSVSDAAGYGRIWHIPGSFTIARDGRLADNGWKDKRPLWTPERLRRVVDPLIH